MKLKHSILFSLFLITPVFIGCSNGGDTPTKDKYTITWTNDDGTVLETDNEVAKGTTPTYDGDTPSKPSDDTYIYTFKGWDPNPYPADKDQTYKATYDKVEVGGADALVKIEIPNDATDLTVKFLYESEGNMSVDWGDNVKNNLSEHTYTTSGKYEIKIGNITSLSIGANPTSQFRTNSDFFKEVYLSDDITSINEYAFSWCSNLISINIPSSVTSIGGAAFGRCSSLTSITIPDSITSIGESAFIYCESLTTITIPNSVTSIKTGAFSNCSSLACVYIPNSVTTIGYWAFNECVLLKIYCEAASQPSGWDPNWNPEDRPIEWNCFAYGEYEDLQYVVVNNIAGSKSITIIGVTDKSITSLIIPSNIYVIDANIPVTSIGLGAFGNCSKLTSINIPSSVTSIGYGAFFNCSSLTSVNIPNSVTSIGGAAFRLCSSLTSITIPDSVTSIGEAAFEHCSKLTSITIPNSVSSIAAFCFYGCSSLTSVTLLEGVTSIGVQAFFGCSSLASISIPNSIVSIADAAFHFCPLQFYTYDNALYLGNDSNNYVVFFRLDYMPVPVHNIEINPNCKLIYSFYDCPLLTSITIPNSVVSIESSAFRSCRSLTSIIIPNSVTSIGEAAFIDCPSLTIYCEATSQPSGWNPNWNPQDRPVEWGYTPN